MLAVERKGGMNLQIQSALALNQKLRRLTTTEVLTFYSRIVKNCAGSIKTLRKNIHKTAKLQKLSFQAALGLIYC